ncbi:MAG: hypothetical protein AAGA25_08820 [Planctomycetota bacterium]
MASRPQTTIIIHTQGWTGRGDVSAGRQPLTQIWRDAPTSLPEATAFVLKEGGPVGRRVWVLDSELWLGLVELPAAAVANLSDNELAGPGAYEAENSGGLTASKSVTAVRRSRVPEHDDQFLVAQCSRERMVAVKQAVKLAGGRLAGVCHPAGLPQALLDDGEQDALAGDWRRIEFWAEEVVLAQRVGGRDQVVPLGMSPRGAWRASLSPLLREEPVAPLEQTLLETGVKPRDGVQWRDPLGAGPAARWLNAGEDPDESSQDGPELWRLDEPKLAEHFVAAWAQRLASDSSAQLLPVPWIKPPKAPAARWPAVAIGVLALLIAVGSFGLQWYQASERVITLTDEIEHEEEEARMLGEIEKKATESKRSVEKKKKQIENLEAELVRAINEKRRKAEANAPRETDYRLPLADLMGSLSRLAEGDLVVESITPGSPRHEISGIAASPESASRLAREMSRELVAWSVSPAQIEPVLTSADPHWRFTIVLDPAVPKIPSGVSQ